jgi:hypothetical protein
MLNISFDLTGNEISSFHFLLKNFWMGGFRSLLAFLSSPANFIQRRLNWISLNFISSSPASLGRNRYQMLLIPGNMWNYSVELKLLISV